MKRFKLLLFIPLCFCLSGLQAQEVIAYEESPCLHKCPFEHEVLSIRQYGEDATVIHARGAAPCNGALTPGAALNNSTLDLQYKKMPTIIIDEKGERQELLEIALCDCMFEMAFTIKGLLPQDFSHVLFNGLEAEVANTRFGIAPELEIIIDFESDSLRRHPD